MLIDSHSHVNFKDFDDEVKECKEKEKELYLWRLCTEVRIINDQGIVS